MRAKKNTIFLLASIATLAAAIALPVASADAPTGSASATPPPRFFGIAPQTLLTETDTSYMRAARIGSLRVPVQWSLVQPTPKSEYNWSGLDQAVEIGARARISVFPFLYSTPHWLGKATTMPIASGRLREAVGAVARGLRRGPGAHVR